MTRKQAYYTLYFLLDKYFETDYKDPVNPSDWGLRIFLSDMNPFIWAERTSADPATEIDFKNAWEKAGNGKSVSEEKALEAAVSFINFYQREFEFKLADALTYLKSANWKESARRFCALYPDDNMRVSSVNPFYNEAQGELFEYEKS
jgi:hypothetical protein